MALRRYQTKKNDEVACDGKFWQNSFDKIDTNAGPQKQVKMVGLMVKFYKEAQKALKAGTSLADIRAMPIIPSLLKSKFEILKRSA